MERNGFNVGLIVVMFFITLTLGCVAGREKALEMLVDTHGEEADVVLYPTAAMQISEENAKKHQ